jgi:ligand-binding sensor domain-containing protein/signal transduction histidine kinase
MPPTARNRKTLQAIQPTLKQFSIFNFQFSIFNRASGLRPPTEFNEPPQPTHFGALSLRVLWRLAPKAFDVGAFGAWNLLSACLGLGLLLLCCPLHAATAPRFTVDVWTADEGLPQSSVFAMTQTRDGYLWLGTGNGLVRFDALGRTTSRATGLRFPVFDDSNTPGLGSGVILKLFEDSHENLWIGTETGVLMVRDGKLTDIGIGRGSRESRLACICEDAKGVVWLCTADSQLYRYQNGKLEPQRLGMDVPGNPRSLIADDAGAVWLATDLMLVVLTPGSTPKASTVPRLDLLVRNSNGGFWLLANGRILSWKTNHFDTFAYYPWNPNTPVNAACQDRRANLVVGTGGEGVFWFDAQGHSAQLSKAQGLSHNTAMSLCTDREGDLWVGTDGGGLNRVKQQLFDVFEGSQALAVKSVSEDASGGLWLGSFGHGVNYLTNGALKPFDLKPGGPADQYVVSVFVDHQQRVWAGTAVGTLFQSTNDSFKPFRPAPGPDLLQGWVYAIFQDHLQRVWIGSRAGLAFWDGAAWKSFTARDGLSANIVRAIAEDPEGNLWVGTEDGGVNRIHDSRCECFGKTNGLASDSVYSLYADPEGVVWAGTSDGLARFQAGKWTSYSSRLGLASHSVGYLLEDTHTNLWLGSNAGLLRAPKVALNLFAAGRADSVPIRSYGQPDGLPTRECTRGAQPAACRDRTGRLWFPTIKGLASVNPDMLSPNTNPPPVIIEAVRVDGIPQGLATLRAPAPASIDVPPGKESLEIDFACLNLAAPDKGRFKYRLEKHESGWTEVPATVRSVRYTKLPARHYIFRVLACNEDEVWNQSGASLAVNVLPPFWQNWWFLTALVLILLAAIVGIVHFVSTQKLHRQLEALRQKEAIERERARIARDLHDQLGANLTQVSLLGELVETDKELPLEVEAHAQQISQTARDTTRALDEIVWTVNPSNDTLDGLINYVCKYAQEYLALAGLRYRLDVPAQLPATPISPELRHNVFLAVKEAVNNVVKHAHASAASLRLRLEPSHFALEIEDNGRGLAGLDEKAAQTRNGLRNMRKRMEDIGGAFSIGPAPEGGTLIRLTAPLNRNAADNSPSPPSRGSGQGCGGILESRT